MAFTAEDALNRLYTLEPDEPFWLTVEERAELHSLCWDMTPTHYPWPDKPEKITRILGRPVAIRGLQ